MFWTWTALIALLLLCLVLAVFLAKRALTALEIISRGGWGCLTGRGHQWEEFSWYDQAYRLHNGQMCKKCEQYRESPPKH